MDSSDPKNPEKGKAKTGGLSASDLRARLGLKPSSSSSGSSASSLRARLGLEPVSKAAEPAPEEKENTITKDSGVEESVRTSRIDESVLDMLRKDNDRDGSALSALNAAKDAEDQKSKSLETALPNESTHALSLDEFEDLLVSGDSPAADASEAQVFDEKSDENEDELDALVDSLGAPPSPAEDEIDPDLAAELAELEAEVEEEEEEDGGEKTQLLDTSSFLEEEEEFDAFPDEEKTQIMMSALDYDPLTGKLILESGDAPETEYILARDKTSIGRGTKNDIVIPDIAMSRKHLLIERFTEGFVLRDQDSGNGTFLNDRRIKYAELRKDDIIEFGNLKFRFEQNGGDPEELWKGVPKIEYHPKDTGAAAPRSSAPAQHAPQRQAPQQQAPRHNPTPAGHIATGVIGPGGQQGFSHPMMNPAQQGMRAQAPWMTNMNYTGFPQAVQPGMMPHQQRKGSPIVTALIVFFSILLLGLMGLIIWTLAEPAPQEDKAAQEAKEKEEKQKQATQFANEGIGFFEQRQWAAAQNSFQTVLQLDPENVLARRYLNEYIPRDQANEATLFQVKNAINSDAKNLANYEEAINFLENISPESIFADEVRNRHLPKVKEQYLEQLKRQAKYAKIGKKYALALRLLDTIETRLGVTNDPEVKQIRAEIQAMKKLQPPPARPDFANPVHSDLINTPDFLCHCGHLESIRSIFTGSCIWACSLGTKNRAGNKQRLTYNCLVRLSCRLCLQLARACSNESRKPSTSSSYQQELALRKQLLILSALILLLAPKSSFAYGLPLQSLSVQLQEQHQLLPLWPIKPVSLESAASWLLEHISPRPQLDVITWSHEQDSTPLNLAKRWGIPLEELLLLNPGLKKHSQVPANTPLVVFEFNPENPPQSIGSASRGHLISAMPMPEGPFWRLRPNRSRHWANKNTVNVLVNTFISYGMAFPGAPLIGIGDLSIKKGGKLRPHRSHRSGRDVDFSYVPTVSSSSHWPKVTSKTIDAEKTWFIVKTMLDTGQVQAIYMDRRLQRALIREALKDLPKNEVNLLFEYSGKRNKNAVIRHWSGHYNHMHVRFHCEPWNAQCKTW